MVARLTLSGSKILDPNGVKFKARGINEARWNTMVQQDAADHVAQGFNIVRLALRWWGPYGGSDIDSRDDTATATACIDPAHLTILDNNISWCVSQGLWVALFVDSNCGQCGVQPGAPAYCDPLNTYGTNGHNFWTDAAVRAKFVQVWAFVANRYKNVPNIAWYELLPEPNAPTATAADITAFYQELMAAITPVDPATPFLIGPGNGYDIRIANTAYIPGAANVIYTGNMFVHVGADITDTATRLQPLLDLRTANNVPIFVQQVGVRSGDDPSMSYQDLVLSLLDANNVGWTWWEYTGGSTGPDEYGIRYKDALNAGNYITKASILGKLSAYAANDQAADPTALDQRITDVLQAVMARQSLLGGVWNTINTREPAVFPYVVFSEIASTTNNTLAGPSALQNSRYQFDVFDLTAKGAKALRKAVGQALLTAFGPPTSCISISSFSVYEDAIKAYRASSDFSIWSNN